MSDQPKKVPTSPLARALDYVREFPLRVIGRLQRDLLRLVIRLKWEYDRRCMPLTPNHRELYDNIHRMSWTMVRSFPNLAHPATRNDALNWIKLFDQRPDSIVCCDKLAVRDYIRVRVGAQHLVTLYQVHERFADIDFETLPTSFVIKTNHDSGTVIIVRDKQRFDRAAAEERVEQALRRPYGWTLGEWAYSYVPPRVFVEELLEPEADVPPADYKFHCVAGHATHAVYIYDRGRSAKSQRIERDGTISTAKRRNTLYAPGDAFRKPPQWDAMVAIADTLGREFMMVRVDMYLTGGRIYVGELTLWSAGGFLRNGIPIDPAHLARLDFTAHRPLLLPELERTRSRFTLYPSAPRPRR